MTSSRVIRYALLQMAMIASASLGTEALLSAVPVRSMPDGGPIVGGRFSPAEGEERVDNKLVSSSGDLSLDQLGWLQRNHNKWLQDTEATGMNSPASPVLLEPWQTGAQHQYNLLSSGNLTPRNYQALIDDFKESWLQTTNPARESRAFKPRLMSTARGFGKRANELQHITLADIIGPSRAERMTLSR